MQLSMLDGLDRYSLRRGLPPDADHVAHSRPVVNTRPLAAHLATRGVAPQSTDKAQVGADYIPQHLRRHAVSRHTPALLIARKTQPPVVTAGVSSGRRPGSVADCRP